MNSRPYIQKAAAFQIEILRNLIFDEEQVPDSAIHGEMCNGYNLRCNHPMHVRCPRQTREDARRMRALTFENTSRLILDQGTPLIEALRQGIDQAFAVGTAEIREREKVGATP